MPGSQTNLSKSTLFKSFILLLRSDTTQGVSIKIEHFTWVIFKIGKLFCIGLIRYDFSDCADALQTQKRGTQWGQLNV